MDTLVNAGNGLLKVCTEAKLLLIQLDPLEAFDLKHCTLKVELELINFALELFQLEINFGRSAEAN